MNMMEKFLHMIKSAFQSYAGEILTHDKDDSEKQLIVEETLTHEQSENEEENDERLDKEKAKVLIKKKRKFRQRRS